MKSNHTRDVCADVRSADMGLIATLKTNKSLAFTLIVIFVLATGIFGYSAGVQTNASVTDQTDIALTDTVFESEIAEQEMASLEIERIDQQHRNDALQEENKEIKEATEHIADTVLDSLMSNLKDKEVASRSHTLTANLKEASNLMNLYWKLQNFKKTADYGLLDISTYENALMSRLNRIPTLKPIPGTFEDFGWRIHPIFKYRHLHPAADQSAPKGTPIKAAGSGYVVSVGYDSRSGYNIKIDHGNGFITIYMHNNKNLVTSGQWVSKGQKIATVGSTGTATGPHLHFQVEYNGTPFDPRKILMQG